MTFGERLRKLRQDKGLSQPQLAAEIGITKQAISNYEKDLFSPSLSVLKEIALTLHCSADYLIGVSDDVRGARK